MAILSTLSRSLREQAPVLPLQHHQPLRHHRVRQHHQLLLHRHLHPLVSAATTTPLLAALATHAALVVARGIRALHHAPSMANNTTASGLAANVLSLELIEESDTSVIYIVVGHIQHGIYCLSYALAVGASNLINYTLNFLSKILFIHFT